MVRDKGGPSPRPRPPDIECISDDVPRGENGRRPARHPALVLISLACVSTRSDGARSHRFLHGLVGSELDLLLGER